mmetsp:Transcript_35354/g.36013  ORF Transcript_35354/g.36013 Transcript_35354/m.36013 type:complete len:81 (+) Transcript_35354:56-298(+)
MDVNRRQCYEHKEKESRGENKSWYYFSWLSDPSNPSIVGSNLITTCHPPVIKLEDSRRDVSWVNTEISDGMSPSSWLLFK